MTSVALSHLVIAVLAVIACYGFYLALDRALLRAAEKGYVHQHLRLVVSGVIKTFLAIAAVMVGLNFLGVSLSSLWAALSALLVMVAIGFVAMWSVLSNALCSVLLVIFSPFRVGDEIEIIEPSADRLFAGKVTGINIMFTTLTSGDGKKGTVRVPNNLFFQKYVRCIPGKRTKSLQDHMAAANLEIGLPPQGDD